MLLFNIFPSIGRIKIIWRAVTGSVVILVLSISTDRSLWSLVAYLTSFYLFIFVKYFILDGFYIEIYTSWKNGKKYIRILDFIKPLESSHVRLLKQDNLFHSGLVMSSRKSLFAYTRVIDWLPKASLDIFEENVLFLGVGGCALPEEIATHFQPKLIDVVEIVPEMINLAQEYFLSKPGSINFICSDASLFIKSTTTKYSFIFIDVPPEVYRTPGMLRNAASLIHKEKGILVINFWGDYLQDCLDLISNELLGRFRTILVVSTRPKRNIVVLLTNNIKCSNPKKFSLDANTKQEAFFLDQELCVLSPKQDNSLFHSFSIIVITADRPSRLVELLDSISKISYKGIYEVIVVDKGRVKIPQVLLKKLNKSKYFHIITIKADSVSFARNAGAKFSSHNHLLFLDDDVTVSPDILKSYNNAWNDYPDAALIGGRILSSFINSEIKNQGVIETYSWCFAHQQLGSSDQHLSLGQILFSANLSLSKKNIVGKQIFNPKLGREYSNDFIFGEDFELSTRCSLVNKDVIYIGSKGSEVTHMLDRSRSSFKYLLYRYLKSGKEMKLIENCLNESQSQPLHNFAKDYVLAITDANIKKRLLSILKVFSYYYYKHYDF